MIPGWTCTELRRWYEEVATNWLPCNGVFVEVGVAYGASLAHLVNHRDMIARIYGVDIFEEHQGKGQISDEDWARCTSYGNPMRAAVGELMRECSEFFDMGGTLIRSTGVAAADGFPDESVDVLFLDEHHTLESVSGAIRAWLPRIVPGGIISGHDCNPHYPGVLEAVNLLLPGAEVRPPHPSDNGWGGVWIWRKPA